MDRLQTPDFLCITDHPFAAFPALRDETSHGCWSNDVRLPQTAECLTSHMNSNCHSSDFVGKRWSPPAPTALVSLNLLLFTVSFRHFLFWQLKTTASWGSPTGYQGYQEGMEYATLRAHWGSPSTSWFSRSWLLLPVCWLISFISPPHSQGGSLCLSTEESTALFFLIFIKLIKPIAFKFPCNQSIA